MALRTGTSGLLAVIAGLLVAGWTASAGAQSVPCQTLELRIAIVPTEPPECSGGTHYDGDTQAEWEYVTMYVDDLFIGVAMERAGLRSAFYRPKLEEYVPYLLGEEGDKIAWGDEIEDDRFDVRRFEFMIDNRTTVMCVGFLDTGPGVMGSEVKSVIYGMFCNIDGSVFFDSDVTSLLAKIGR